jgi:hypothetical protein
MKITKNDINPMDEAYKLLTGDPSIKAVSQAAKGEIPLSDDEQRMKDYETDEKCQDINQAYAMLFESLAMIIKSK